MVYYIFLNYVDFGYVIIIYLMLLGIKWFIDFMNKIELGDFSLYVVKFYFN